MTPGMGRQAECSDAATVRRRCVYESTRRGRRAAAHGSKLAACDCCRKTLQSSEPLVRRWGQKKNTLNTQNTTERESTEILRYCGPCPWSLCLCQRREDESGTDLARCSSEQGLGRLDKILAPDGGPSPEAAALRRDHLGTQLLQNSIGLNAKRTQKAKLTRNAVPRACARITREIRLARSEKRGSFSSLQQKERCTSHGN